MQKCKFFMEYLRVSQGYGVNSDGSKDTKSYSHTGSYALDLGGKDKAALDWAYAPCDVVVKRVYGTYNAVWFETLEEVMCADGKARKLVFLMIHINKADLQALGIAPGKIFKQGEKFYREGTAGNVTGAHIHCEVGLAPFTGTGWYNSMVQDRSGADVWKINSQQIPHEIFILGNDVEILNGNGYNWKADTIKGLTKLKIGWASSGDLNTLVNLIVAIGGINADIKDGYIYTSPVSKGDKATITEACAELGVACTPYEEDEEVTYLVGPLSIGQDALITACQELGVHYELVENSDTLTEETKTEKNPEEKTEKTEDSEPAPEENTPEAPQPEETPENSEEIPEDNKEPEKEETGENEPNTGAGAEDNNVPDKPAADTNVGTERPDVPDTNVGNPPSWLKKMLDAIVKFFKAILG